MSGVRGDGVGVLFVDATDLVERAIRGAVLLLFRAGSVAAVPSVEVRGSTKTVKFENTEGGVAGRKQDTKHV